MSTYALNNSLSQRCLELNNLIKEKLACNTSRNLLSQFKPIVESIFGHDTSNDLQSRENRLFVEGGWQLKNLTRSSNGSDYESAISFLHPDGILFALIRSLMTETNAKFEFPVSHFPPYHKAMIENGTAPPFFANKIISTSYGSASHLILNPFEYYVFHYGLYILNNNNASCDSLSLALNEPAYFTLLKIYLNHFVPLEEAPRSGDNPTFASNNQQSSLWQSLSSTTTSMFNLATNATSSSNAQGNNILPSLFKASIFQPQTPFNQNLSSNYMSRPGPILYGQGEHLRSLEWRCSTFLLMLTELWFGNIPVPGYKHVVPSTALDDLPCQYSANIDQMTAIRIVIKHLHNFSSTFTYNPISHVNNHGLAEIKQAIWTSKYPLQKRLYNFIKVAFSLWPMDYNFRHPLEAWLSYIQPWRYVKTNTDLNNDFEELDSNKTGTLLDVPSIDNHWRNFISDNLLYYTLLFTMFVNRMLKLDLTSSRNALLIFRVLKVYSQPGFLPLVRDAEETLMLKNLNQTRNMSTNKSPQKPNNPNRTQDLDSSKAKLLAPSFLASGRVSTPMTSVGVLEHHLSNLESDSEFNYISLFSPQMKQHLSRLLIEIQRARISIRESIQAIETRSKLRSRSWLESIKAFITMEDGCFESEDERDMYKDGIHAEDYLDFVVSKITQCFDVQLPEIDLHNRTTASPIHNRTSKIVINR